MTEREKKELAKWKHYWNIEAVKIEKETNMAVLKLISEIINDGEQKWAIERNEVENHDFTAKRRN